MSTKKPVGAWYFPGWADDLTKPVGAWNRLAWPWRAQYPERMPLVGWYDEARPEVMDAAMRQAAGAVDYFAFNWYYDADTKRSGGEYALNNFLASTVGGIKCAIAFESSTAEVPVRTLADWHDIVDRWGFIFESPKYLKIDGRPVVFVVKLHHMHAAITQATGLTHAELLDVARRRTGQDIYFVAGSAASPYWTWQAQLAGYDAFSMYNMFATTSGGQGPAPATYAELVDNYATEWAWLVANCPIDIMLPMTVGWDAQPVGGGVIGVPTSDEFRAHLQAAKAVIDGAEKVRGGVLYAWNEHGEGGVLCPTAEFGRELLGVFRSEFA